MAPPAPITAQQFVSITPQHNPANAPKPDIIIIPGGDVEEAMQDTVLRSWLQRNAADSAIIMSVCTGAGVLSLAGLLDGKTVTTFHNFIQPLQRITPLARVVSHRRFVDNGRITIAGSTNRKTR
ncbi:DJ-1/PfpI family protein [Deminuibacter soli]|uniref:DJ-1/PfpI domain-containing protein n=1 Tax=Deminuibacter soli TaxID=2291815 RepID=A0A3E1NKN3_9BACT|nr:DJ-1/PfpI family protein [Deminuibacter soli]RFM28486.1 hypothetical protein DXN05_06675 [Deminuibacter soli]